MPYREPQPQLLEERCECGHPKDDHYWFNSEFCWCNGPRLLPDAGCDCTGWRPVVRPVEDVVPCRPCENSSE